MTTEVERSVDEPPWALWTVPAALLLGLGIWIISIALVRVAAQASGGSIANPNTGLTLALNLAQDLSFVAATLYFTVFSGPGRLPDFGFRRIRPSFGVRAAVAAGLVYYGATVVYGALFNLHSPGKLPKGLKVTGSTSALIAAALFVCVFAPIVEEFFFRGFLFGTLRKLRISIGGREVGPWVAAVVVGLVFGFAHVGSTSVPYLVALAFLGFLLCLLRWRTRSLYPCMALHSLNNSLALGINQLSWGTGAILGLIAGSLILIGLVTAPLSGGSPRAAGV